MKTIARTATGLVVGALLLTGCGSSDDAAPTTTTKPDAASTTAPSLQIDDVWARQSPMGTSTGAVYLTITSPIDDALVGASVPTSIAGTTEIHETVAADDTSSTTAAMGDDAGSNTAAMGGDATTTTAMGGDAMTMKPVASIELPAGTPVALAPGGYHIMLMDLVAPLEVGQTFDVTLSFEMAGDRTVQAEVREG